MVKQKEKPTTLREKLETLLKTKRQLEIGLTKTQGAIELCEGLIKEQEGESDGTKKAEGKK